MKKKGEGPVLLSLEVDDLDAAMAEMEQRGIRLVSDATLDKARIAVYHPADLHGMMIKLIEYKK